MSRCVFLAILCLFFVSTDCREGWKTNGNGYLIYSAKTNFSSTGKVEVTGTYATKPKSTNKNVLLAFEDSNGDLTAQVMVDGGILGISERRSKSIESHSFAYKTNYGYVFNFTCSLAQRAAANGKYEHSVTAKIHGFSSITISVIDSVSWNMDKMKIYIGGYEKSVNQGAYFEGCLSNFVFQGTDMIGKYFHQFPNNKNPVRSSITVGRFSNVTEQCNDVMRPTPTRRPPRTTAPGGNPNGCIKNTFNVGIILANMVLAFSYCMM